MSKLHETIVWAILYNHSWDPSGYPMVGFWISLLLISCLIVSLFSGAYLSASFFFVVLIGEAFLAKFIWNTIKSKTL